MAKFLGEPTGRRCGVCDAAMKIHQPDNATEVPCCPACWAQFAPAVKISLLLRAKQVAAAEDLNMIFHGWLEEKVGELLEEKKAARYFEAN